MLYPEVSKQRVTVLGQKKDLKLMAVARIQARQSCEEVDFKMDPWSPILTSNLFPGQHIYFLFIE